MRDAAGQQYSGIDKKRIAAGGRSQNEVSKATVSAGCPRPASSEPDEFPVALAVQDRLLVPVLPAGRILDQPRVPVTPAGDEWPPEDERF